MTSGTTLLKPVGTQHQRSHCGLGHRLRVQSSSPWSGPFCVEVNGSHEPVEPRVPTDANPTEAHPVTGAKMKQAAMKGVTTIVIDPREIKIAKYADHFLQLRPGTNVALLNMMLYYIIDEGLEDSSFIESRTEGYDDFIEQLRDLDIDEMERITGVDGQTGN